MRFSLDTTPGPVAAIGPVRDSSEPSSRVSAGRTTPWRPSRHVAGRNGGGADKTAGGNEETMPGVPSDPQAPGTVPRGLGRRGVAGLGAVLAAPALFGGAARGQDSEWRLGALFRSLATSSVLGTEALTGAEIAVEMANERGGVLGRPEFVGEGRRDQSGQRHQRGSAPSTATRRRCSTWSSRSIPARSSPPSAPTPQANPRCCGRSPAWWTGQAASLSPAATFAPCRRTPSSRRARSMCRRGASSSLS